ncbi:MAG: hypothetical protein NVS1B14_02010 [Vulcanimicrobiaceae bacterium]
MMDDGQVRPIDRNAQKTKSAGAARQKVAEMIVDVDAVGIQDRLTMPRHVGVQEGSMVRLQAHITHVHAIAGRDAQNLRDEEPCHRVMRGHGYHKNDRYGRDQRRQTLFSAQVGPL